MSSQAAKRTSHFSLHHRSVLLASLSMFLMCACAGAALRRPTESAPGHPSQNPASPANEVVEIECIIEEKRIRVPSGVHPGASTVSFSNATKHEVTAEIEGHGERQRVERAIPPAHSMTLEVWLKPGVYVITSVVGRKRLTANLRVQEP